MNKVAFRLLEWFSLYQSPVSPFSICPFHDGLDVNIVTTFYPQKPVATGHIVVKNIKGSPVKPKKKAIQSSNQVWFSRFTCSFPAKSIVHLLQYEQPASASEVECTGWN